MILRVLCVAAAAAYAAAAAFQFYGDWLLSRPSHENLSRGVRWHSGNSQFWTAYGRYWLFAPDGTQPDKAVEAYRRAIGLNPFNPASWDGLATAYLQLADQPKAEAALRGAVAVLPHSPRAGWRLANFLLLQGRHREALPALRVAAAADRNLRAVVFDLGWKILGDPADVLRQLVPVEPEARADYLTFLMGRGKLVEAYDVWREIHGWVAATGSRLGYNYTEALAWAGRGQEAARVWEQLQADLGLSVPKPEGELICNGDFETEIQNAGLDWHLDSGAGWKISLDNFVLQNASRSLRVAFEGTANPDFAAVWQLVPVEPNQQHLFRGYLKTDSITTDQGVFFEVRATGVPAQESFILSTPVRTGTNPWTEERLAFRTGPNTRVVALYLRRRVSSKFNNKIQGKVWIDNLSIQKQ